MAVGRAGWGGGEGPRLGVEAACRSRVSGAGRIEDYLDLLCCLVVLVKGKRIVRCGGIRGAAARGMGGGMRADQRGWACEWWKAA